MKLNLDKQTLFNYLRNAPFGGRLATGQVAGVERLLKAWDKLPVSDLRLLAYAMATSFHETNHTMQPVRETLANSTAQAIARLDSAYAKGQLKQVKKPYWRKDKDGIAWFGRGDVQLTHQANYLRMEKITGIPLTKDPDLALDPDNSAVILFEGLLSGESGRGDFTKYKLEDFFNETTNDPIGARKVVNGTDKAKLIAGYYQNFLDAINAAVEAWKKQERPPEVTKAAALPDDIPATESATGIALPAATGLSGLALPFVTGVDNIYSLVLSLFLIAVAVTLIVLFSTGKLTIGRSK